MARGGFLLSGHEGEGEPRVHPRDKLSEEFQIETGDVSLGIVFTTVPHPHVVDLIRDEMVEFFIIDLAGELERPVESPEGEITSQYHMYRALRLDVLVETHRPVSPAVLHRIAKFLVKRRLVIYARGETESKARVEGGIESDRRPGRDNALPIIIPV